MNRDEGSYQLSHIKDDLFALKLSGEQQLHRPFRSDEGSSRSRNVNNNKNVAF